MYETPPEMAETGIIDVDIWSVITGNDSACTVTKTVKPNC